MDVGIDRDVDMDIDSDMAVSTNWGEPLTVVSGSVWGDIQQV